MTITNPGPLLDSIEIDYLYKCLGQQSKSIDDSQQQGGIIYSEPFGNPNDGSKVQQDKEANRAPEDDFVSNSQHKQDQLHGKVLRLGDFIDTDAVSRPLCMTDGLN